MTRNVRGEGMGGVTRTIPEEGVAGSGPRLVEADCSVTVGDGLVVHGTVEAVGRVQDYILLDSTHPTEAEDVRRSLARQLQAAEEKIRVLETRIRVATRVLTEGSS